MSKSKLDPRVGLHNCSLRFVFFIQEGSLGGRQQKGGQSWAGRGGGSCAVPDPQLAEKTSGSSAAHAVTVTPVQQHTLFS